MFLWLFGRLYVVHLLSYFYSNFRDIRSPVLFFSRGLKEKIILCVFNANTSILLIHSQGCKFDSISSLFGIAECGPMRDENGEWRRLQNEELHSLCRSPNIVRVIKSRRLRWTGHVARMEETKSAFNILTAKPIGKRPLGRPRRRWVDNIRMDLKEIDINTRNWVDQLRIGIIGEHLWMRHWISGFHKPWS